MKVIPATNADNPLYLGKAIHTGIEKGVQAAIKEYFDTFPIIDDLHINETIKMEYLIPKVKELLPEGIYELQVMGADFIGFLDLLVPVNRTTSGEDGDYETNMWFDEKGNEVYLYDLYDFKYSNNIKNYMESRQLHEYKYFFEKTNPGKKIRNLYFVFIPKVQIKQKKTEDLWQFRNRMMDELNKSEIQIVPVDFDYTKVIDFYSKLKEVLETKEYPKEPSYLCNWCDYQEFCVKGIDYMLLPSNERRNIGEAKKRRIWIYGASFSGKTTMLDAAPDPLNLNTDGNIQFVTMPYIPIKDEIKVEGRMTKRTFAWDVFKDVISELEKKQNNFKTIIVDLLEDTREMCRIKMYDDLGIQHESDSGFGKGWDIIKTEYLSTIRRFFNLDYENLIVVSHEDVSKDITKKNGQNITRIAPNIQDAIANKVAGMVDIVARVVVEDDGSRTLNFKSNEVIFGGGRLKGIKSTTIPLSWDALVKVYDEVNELNEVKDTPPTPDPEKEEKDSFRDDAEKTANEVAGNDKPTTDGTGSDPASDSEKSTSNQAPEANNEKAAKPTRRKRS